MEPDLFLYALKSSVLEQFKASGLNLLQVCHNILVLCSLINCKSHPNDRPTCSDSQCFFFLKMYKLPELYFCCRPFNQSHHSSALYFQSRLELKRAVSACTCGGWWAGCVDSSRLCSDTAVMELIDHLYGRLLALLALAYSNLPTPPSQRHRRHYRANLGGSTLPHRLQPGHGFDIGCTI